MADTPPNNTPPNSKKIALEAAKERREQVINDLELLDVQRRMAISDKERAKIQREINKLIKEEDGLRQRIALYGEREEKLQKSIADSLADQISELKTKSKINDKILNAEKDQLSRTKTIQDLLKKGNITYERAEDLLKKINREAKEKIAIEEHSMKMAKDRLALEEKVAKIQHAKKEAQLASAKGYVNDIENNIRKIPVAGDLLANMFMNEKSKRKMTVGFYKLFRKNSPMMKKINKNLPLLTAGFAVASAGVKMGLGREQEMKDQQRSIGLTNEQSVAIDKMQRGLLNSSKSMVTTMEEARKASAELVEDFGTYGALNETLVDQQVKLTKAYGLQAEDASNFQRTAKIAGKDTEVVKKEVFAVAAGFNKATGSSQSLSAVLRSVSKVSDSIRIQFRGSDTELTHAVMKAKMLGTTLEDLNGIADQLLNIESSIENQVTAQLVTGRNINMDKARMFALQDDMNGLMDELVKQEIDYNSYSKMNRVEKQSTAAALGMNVDQMAKFVSQQELARKLNIDMAAAENQTSAGLERSLKSNQERIAQMAAAGDLAAQQYEKDNEALTTQEKMTKAIEQMAYLFKWMAPIVIGIGVMMMSMAIAAMMTMGSLTLGVSIAAGIAAAVAAAAFLPGMATGGEVVAGKGPVIVGENGPEIVHLKKGNTVTPNSQLSEVINPQMSKSATSKPDKITTPPPTVNVSLVVGNTAITEIGNKISMNNSYNAGVGNSYNRLGNT